MAGRLSGTLMEPGDQWLREETDLVSVSSAPIAAPTTGADCELEEEHTGLVISQLEQLALHTEKTNVLLGLIDLQAVMEELNKLFQADCCSTLIGQDPFRYWALIGCQMYYGWSSAFCCVFWAP